MERVDDKRLTELRNSGAHIYSISRLNAMNQCPYQAYLSYVKHEEQKKNIWAVIGGITHDALQKCIDTGCDESIIKESVSKELENLELLDIDFPLDRKGEPTIRNNWISNMTRFAEEFKTPKGIFETEQLVLYPVPGQPNCYMQGYIDLIKHNNDNTITIIDWKTSAQFTKEHLIEAGRQLILYGLAKQAEGYKIKKLSWCMLKYCITSWKLKNGKTKEKISEWRNLVKDLKSVLETKLSEIGLDELDIEIILDEALSKNSLDVLPDEVKNQFKTKIYVRDYDFSQENIDETLDYIINMINKYESYSDNEKNYLPCDISKNGFFCNSLCGYGYEKCKYFRDYCSQLQDIGGDNDDIF